jgi:non-specific serine/threonine protein kinase
MWEEGAAMKAAERSHPDPWGVTIFTTCLIGLRAVQQRHAEANVLAVHAMALCGDLEDPVRTAWCLESIASAQAAQGQPLRSARLWGASEQLMERSAASLPPSFAWVREHYFDGVKDGLGDAVFQSALSDGRAMSMRQAIQHALEACKPS